MRFNALVSTIVAGAAITTISSASLFAQSAPQFDSLPFANDTSWAGVEYRGDPVGAYGRDCAFALQMDFRQMRNGSRELVVQTACENLDGAEMNFIVPEGETRFISNLPHPGANFYDVSADGREIRFVRIFDPSAHDGVSRDRVRIRVDPDHDTATVFWEVRQNNQWRTLGSAVAWRLVDHDIYRPVLDEGEPQMAAASIASPGSARRRRQPPIEIRPINQTGENLVAIPSWIPTLNQGGSLPFDRISGSHNPDNYEYDQSIVPGLGNRPPRRVQSLD